MAISRRRLLVLGSALAVTLAFVPLAPAQPMPKVHRVAFLATTSPPAELSGARPANPAARSFADELRALGFVQGRNLILDMRTLEGKLETLDAVVAEIVRLKPDVIFLPGQIIARPAVRLTGDIPIVSLFASGVVQTGLVKSLARPGGTVTGVVVDVDAAAEAKRLELLLELVPSAKRVAFLGIESIWQSAAGDQIRASARKLGIDLFFVRAEAANYTDALATLAHERPDAVYVPAGPTNYGRRREIGRFLSRERLPGSCAHSEFVDEGCLMSYGVEVDALMRRAARYVAKILNGAKPGDLPIEQPTNFDLVINRRAVQALGLTIPPALLARAHRVIE